MTMMQKQYASFRALASPFILAAAMACGVGFLPLPATAQDISADEGGYGPKVEMQNFASRQDAIAKFLVGSWVYQEIVHLPVQGERVVETVVTFLSDNHFERQMTDIETGKNITVGGVYEIRPMANENRFAVIMTQPGKTGRPVVLDKVDQNRIRIRANDTIASRL